MLINNEKNRNLTIDGLLAIAALFVLFHHVLGWTKGDWGSLGAVGVMLFFLISGYCITLSLSALGTKPISTFLVRRFSRLYPTYWIAVIFSAFMVSPSPSLQQILYNLSMFQKAFGVIDVSGVFWTLFLEIIFYGLVVCLLMVGSVAYKRSTYIFLSLFFIGMAFINVSIRTAFGFHLPFGHFMFISIFFMGSLTAMTYSQQKKMNAVYLLACGYLVLVYWIEYLICHFDWCPAYFQHHFWNYVWSFTLFFIAIQRKWFAWSWFSSLGKISYGIYLFHTLMIIICEQFVLNIWIQLAVVLILTLIFSFLVYRFIEAPCIQLGKKFVSGFVYREQYA